MATEVKIKVIANGFLVTDQDNRMVVYPEVGSMLVAVVKMLQATDSLMNDPRMQITVNTEDAKVVDTTSHLKVAHQR